jgi:uncharacterized membrane protein YccC
MEGDHDGKHARTEADGLLKGFAAARSSMPDLARLPIPFNPRATSLAEGVRAGLSVAAIVAASEFLHWPAMMEAALAALFTCLCDAGGPMRRRLPALLSFVVLGALLVGIGGLLRGLGIGVALAASVLVIFCGGFARIHGQAAQQVGTLLCVVMVLSLDRALPDLESALKLGGMFAAGGLWATLLTLVIWRVHPFAPIRRMLSDAFGRLALMTQDLQALLGRDAVDALQWDRHARGHRRLVRDAIEAARGAVLDTLRGRGAASERASQSLIRVETADQLFGSLIALSELLETATPAQRRIVARALRRLRRLLSMLGRAILRDFTPRRDTVANAITALAADVASLEAGTPLRHLLEAIVSRVQIAHTLDIPGGVAQAPGQDARLGGLWQRVRLRIVANLNWQSAAFRHALRAAVTATPAIVFTLVWFTPYDHWLTITIVTTMQPYFANTLARALERVGGTMAGGVLASILGLFVTTKLAIAVTMFPLAILALALRAASFGLFTMVLTPMIVLLAELGQPDTSQWIIAATRAVMTLSGGLLAIAGCTLLWPSWEPQRLAGELRQAIAAHARYATAELSAFLHEADAGAVEVARRAAGLSSNNLEASVSRALMEPGDAARDRLEAVMVVDAALRRFAGRLSAMQHDPGLADAVPPELWRAWRGWVGDSLAALAEGRTGLTPPPKLPDAPHNEALGRIGRQIELIDGTLARVKV